MPEFEYEPLKVLSTRLLKKPWWEAKASMACEKSCEQLDCDLFQFAAPPHNVRELVALLDFVELLMCPPQ